MVVEFNLTTVLLALISLVSTIALAYIRHLDNRATAIDIKADTIHTLVNDKASESEKAIASLNEQILKLSTDRATLLQVARQREADAATAAGIAAAALAAKVPAIPSTPAEPLQ